jgi:hypothetical protein
VAHDTDYTTCRWPTWSRAVRQRATRNLFSHLDEQLNWRPAAASWSVAQCFDHLLNGNHGMLQVIDAAMTPGIRGRCSGCRSSGVSGDADQIADAGREAEVHGTPPGHPGVERDRPMIIERFVAHQVRPARAGARRARRGRIVMVSPFIAFITYSVLDGCRPVTPTPPPGAGAA